MSDIKNKDNRILYIDLLRWLAIISVVLLHCLTPYFTNLEFFETKTWWAVNIINGVSRFGVPIFFMISGYLLLSEQKADESISFFIKKRFIKILSPFVLWNIVYYIYFAIENGKNLSIRDFIYRFITMDISYQFWFVYTLLALYLLIPIVKGFCQKASNIALFYFLLVVIFPTTIGTFINKISGVWLFRFEPVIVGYFGYMLLGYIIGRNIIAFKMRILIYILGVFSVGMSILGTYLYSTKELVETFFNGGYQINSYFIAAAIFIFIRELCNYIHNEKVISIIRLNGSLSFGVYLAHALVLYILKINVELNISDIYQVLFYFLSTAVISTMLTYAIYSSNLLRKYFL